MSPRVHRAVLSIALVAGLLGATPLVNAAGPDAIAATGAIQLVKVGHLEDGVAEISAYDSATKRLFVTGDDLKIYDISDPAEPELVAAVPIAPTSVAAKDGVVAAAVPASPATEPGSVVIMNTDGVITETLEVGALPDMLTFTADGTKILVANEGEPGAIDPEGSVSVITLGSPSSVQTAGFSVFNAQRAALVESGVRIFPSAASVAQDLEPEYIAISPDGTKAWVTLQEANSVAVVDVASAMVESIVPLGLKDWNSGPGLDPSDKDGAGGGPAIKLGNWPVKGMYMPDGIASLARGGQTYYLTANEGDARNEVARASTLNLDPTAFPNAAELKSNAALGRLNCSKLPIDGDIDGDGDFDHLQTYGGRSFTVWDSAGNVVFDSGDQLERITADLTPTLFNANDGDPAKVDQRSDDKGPEPEGIAVGDVDGTPYVFVGLERAGGGIVAYDVSDPAAPEFATYGRYPGDISPEGLTFVPEADSPIEAPLLVASNEVSKSVTIFAVVEPDVEASPVPGVRQVHPVLETRSVVDADADDVEADQRTGSADDPAIWVHPTDSSKSLVLGALKDGGMDVYDLDGQLVQEIAPADIRYNNVDVAYGVELGGMRVDIAVATDRKNDMLVIFRIDPQTRQLVDVTDTSSPLVFTPRGEESNGTTTAYGIATWMAPNGRTYAFVNQRERGTVAQLELISKGEKLGWKTVRSFTLQTPAGGEPEDAQCEGMAVDQQLGWLYIGQENVGIWKTRVEPNTGYKARLIHTVKSSYLEADVEGLTVYYGAGSRGYLLASSQGDSTFAVFGRTAMNRYLGQFQVTGEGAVDGSQDCDGASVMSLPMGSRFPKGLLVVHDGYDDPAFMVHDDGEFENAAGNFKFVPWDAVATGFSPDLLVDTKSYDPRKR